MCCKKNILHLLFLLHLMAELTLGARTRSDRDGAVEDETEMTTETVSTTTTDEVEQFNATSKKSTTTVDELSTKASDDHENDVRARCPHFKNSNEINIERMVDVWQTVYYQVPHKVPCFKMLIKKVTSEEKDRYSQLYGDFNERVIWDDCDLEIKSSAGLATRKHFLQGCGQQARGVLENIILEQEDNDTAVTLHDESPDQWTVVNNLLLMRDCENGEIVVFSRAPHQPTMGELATVLGGFDGEWACAKNDKRQAFDGDFDGDSDVVFFE